MDRISAEQFVGTDGADDGRTLEWHEAASVAFPAHWRPILVERVPFYRELSTEERVRFEDKVKVFVFTKVFSGHGGLVVSEEMKVVVAAAAARLTMNMPWEHYSQLVHVGLRSSAFGQYRGHTIIGPGCRRKVTISWPALVEGLAVPHDGFNVGYREFAHALNDADGSMDGQAAGAGFEVYDEWDDVISSGRASVADALLAKVAPPIDGDAAASNAEFFAFATEWFFERPRALRERMPAVYSLLSRFYRQDPPLEAVEEPGMVVEEPLEVVASSEPGALAVDDDLPLSRSTAVAPLSSPTPVRRGVLRSPVRIREPRARLVADLIRYFGWTCVFVAFVLILPVAGAGTGRSHEPGSDTVTILASTRGLGFAALVIGGLGVVAVLVGSLFGRRSELDP